MATALATPTPTPARTMATSVCGVSTTCASPTSSPRAASIATISGSAAADRAADHQREPGQLIRSDRPNPCRPRAGPIHGRPGPAPASVPARAPRSAIPALRVERTSAPLRARSRRPAVAVTALPAVFGQRDPGAADAGRARSAMTPGNKAAPMHGVVSTASDSEFIARRTSIADRAEPTSTRMSRACPAKIRPAGVSVAGRRVRSISCVPSSRSRAAMCALTRDCDRWTWADAAVNPPRSTTARKVSSQSSSTPPWSGSRRCVRPSDTPWGSRLLHPRNRSFHPCRGLFPWNDALA